jgi:hypothetical protein
MSDEIDRLLAEHEERLEAAESEKQRAEAKDEKFRQAVADVLSDVVLPTLGQLSVALGQRGHRSNVDDYSQRLFPAPSVSFYFAYGNEEGTQKNPPSAISFKFAPGAAPSIEISTSYSGRAARDKEDIPGVPKRAPTPIKAVDEEWVKSHALSFVEQVLRAYE